MENKPIDVPSYLISCIKVDKSVQYNILSIALFLRPGCHCIQKCGTRSFRTSIGCLPDYFLNGGGTGRDGALECHRVAFYIYFRKTFAGDRHESGNNAHLEIPEVKSVVISKGLTYFPSLCLMSIVARIDTAAIYIYK